MGQGRWVSYIFRYRNKVKCESAGFIKVQRISQKADEFARIQIGLKLYKKKACKCMAYLICGEKQAKYMTDIYFRPEERDTIMKRVELPWGNPLGDGIPMGEYDGVFFVCDDGEILVAMWNEFDIDVGDMRFEKEASMHREENTEDMVVIEGLEDSSDKNESVITEESKKDDIAEEMESAYTEAENRDYMQVCYDMMDTYPKLPLFPDSQFIECVKIVPHDIGKLAMGNWKLGVNSFLSHGYYHYRYLMLGKVKFDMDEKYVIGVPGVFTNKEKYLANMFGFNIFIPVKRTKILTGNFGYWISEVSKV